MLKFNENWNELMVLFFIKVLHDFKKETNNKQLKCKNIFFAEILNLPKYKMKLKI
jgi:hypothetical protein